MQSYKHLLHAYLYDEVVAGCGGDNVTSLILKNPHDGGILNPTKGPGGKLVVGMDNCPSQNKKNHLLRTLCAWLVDKEYFDEVLGLFLVKGHTKNPDDHLFNYLKQFYRQHNIETFNHLVRVLDQSYDVNALAVEPSDFHGWNYFLMGKMYSKFPKVLQYQLFKGLGEGFVEIQHADGEAVFTSSLMHSQDEDPDLSLSRLRDLEPCQIEPPGISNIKRCKLFNKLRPFLIPENRDINCPHPGKEILDRINKHKNKKNVCMKK